MTQAALLAVEADSRDRLRYDSEPPVGDVSITPSASLWKRPSGKGLLAGSWLFLPRQKDEAGF